MAARRTERIRAVARVIAADVDDPATARAIGALSTATQDLQAQAGLEVVATDLVVGANIVRHNLGRAPRFVQITPTVADASFGWAWIRTTPHPDRQVRIDVIGVDQPGAAVIVS